MCVSPVLLWLLLDLNISAIKHYLVDTFLVLGVQNWALYPDAVSLGTEQRTLTSLVCFCQYRPGCGRIDFLQGLRAKAGQELIPSRTGAQGQTGKWTEAAADLRQTWNFKSIYNFKAWSFYNFNLYFQELERNMSLDVWGEQGGTWKGGENNSPYELTKQPLSKTRQDLRLLRLSLWLLS